MNYSSPNTSIHIQHCIFLKSTFFTHCIETWELIWLTTNLQVHVEYPEETDEQVDHLLSLPGGGVQTPGGKSQVQALVVHIIYRKFDSILHCFTAYYELGLVLNCQQETQVLTIL